MAKTETVDAAGNATSSPALVMSAAFWFDGASSAALAVHQGIEHASVSAMRRKLPVKATGYWNFLGVELSFGISCFVQVELLIAR